VGAHATYPEEAQSKGQHGDATVQVFANPDGHVTSVVLQQSSGSKAIDDALAALFTDADLPALPGVAEPITFHFTMHYNLLRRP
jgi:TonB family protein